MAAARHGEAWGGVTVGRLAGCVTARDCRPTVGLAAVQAARHVIGRFGRIDPAGHVAFAKRLQHCGWLGGITSAMAVGPAGRVDR